MYTISSLMIFDTNYIYLFVSLISTAISKHYMLQILAYWYVHYATIDMYGLVNTTTAMYNRC